MSNQVPTNGRETDIYSYFFMCYTINQNIKDDEDKEKLLKVQK